MAEGDAKRLEQLVAAVCSQQRDSWRRGECTPVESYLKEHVSIVSVDECLLDVVYNEICLRSERGHTIDYEEYERRFPSIAGPLHDLLEVHDALACPALSVELAACEIPPAGPKPATVGIADDVSHVGEDSESPPRSTTQADFPTIEIVQATPPLPEAPSASASWEQVVRHLGDYEIVEMVAHGGMGVVFKARQKSLDRIVALKMIRSGRLASPKEIGRFHAEAKSAAKLRHPNIVAIFEVGEAEGQHFFSMDYIDGPTLDNLIREHPLPAARAARYLLIVTEAVEYAHKQFLLHRDLKPSNILVDANDQPQITDFGLAKRVDSGATIEDGATIVGTPSYMPPEQIDRRVGEVGPTSDIYALGAILYEMLVGHPPFRAATPVETMMQVLRKEAVPPRVLNPTIDRDLETIALKCLEKDPRRRYATAGDLADDLRRFLDGRPIQARPISWFARMWRAAKKRPMLTALGTAVVLLVLVLAIAGPWVAVRETQLKNAAERELRISTAHRLAAESRNTLAASPPRSLLLAVEALRQSAGRGEPPVVAAEQVLRDVLGQVGGPPLCGVRGRVPIFKFSPAGRWLAATVEGDAAVRIWDFDGDPITTPPRLLTGQKEQLSALAFSPNNAWLATAGWDGSLRLWDPKRPTAPPISLPGNHHAVYLLAISDDSRWLVAAGGDNMARLWRLDRPAARMADCVLRGHTGRITGAAFSRDGRWLVTASDDGTARLWNLTAADPSQAVTVIPGHDDGTFEVRISPDSRWLVTTARPDFNKESSEYAVRLSNLKTSAPAGDSLVLAGHRGPIVAADISPDSRWLVTGSLDGTARLWDLAAKDPGTTAIVLPGHDGGTAMTAFSGDNHWLMTLAGYTAKDGNNPLLRLWDLTVPNPEGRPTVLVGHTRAVRQAAFAPGGRWLVTASADGAAGLWDLQANDPAASWIRLSGHEEPIDHFEISPDGRLLATAASDGTLRVWSLESPTSNTAVVTLTAGGSKMRLLAASADAQLLAGCDEHGTAYVWDLKRKPLGKPLTVFRQQGSVINAALFTPQRRELVTAGDDGTVRLWQSDAKGETPSLVLRGPQTAIFDLAVSRDGRRLAAGQENGSIGLWDLTQTDRPPLVLGGHHRAVIAVDLSRDGDWLASGSQDSTVRLWNLSAPTPQEKGQPLDRHEGPVFSVRFTEDGRWLITGSLDGTVHLRGLSTTGLTAKPVVLHEEQKDLDALCVSPDGRWLATTDTRGGTSLWDLSTATPRTSPTKLHGQPGSRNTLTISPDSRWLAAGGEGGAIHLWRIDSPLSRSVVLHGHRGAVSMIAVTADSHWLVTAGVDGTIRLWNFRLQELVDLAASIAGRNFSPTEWQAFFPELPYRATFPTLPIQRSK